MGVPRGGPSVPHRVVLRLLEGLHNRGHCVVMDNYFTSVPLFRELASLGTYATGTARSNRIGLPTHLKTAGNFRRSPQGHLEWRMHCHRGMSCVMWKDKRPVLLLSTHANPITSPDEPQVVVPRRNGAIREDIPTSPILLEYTKYMRGVDVADQLRASYSSQTRSHKWWHRVFWFLVDTSIVNMYVMYLNRFVRERIVESPMTHLQFKTKLCEELLQGYELRSDRENAIRAHQPCVHFPSHSEMRRTCVVCKTRAIGHIVFNVVETLCVGEIQTALRSSTRTSKA